MLNLISILSVGSAIMTSTYDDYTVIHPEVGDALSENRPVVALESTIISHGMAYPRNVETALALEQLIRSKGAVPATIAIISGKIRIGLSSVDLELLGWSKDIRKASRRDIPILVAEKFHGSTTVSATMFCASLAGIKLFVTGGIGGVHRGAEKSFDISADLRELASTPVAVVCAGAKAILDLPLTLEYLETQGVPVLGFGTDEFPSFYSRKSGLTVDFRVDTAAGAARIMDIKWRLGLQGGMVIANPIPENHEIPAADMERHITAALEEARGQGIKGKALTPFLLERLGTITSGRSLESNIALVKNNALVGADIAVAFNELHEKSPAP
jgi:pseudouridylate synthase